MTRRLTQMVAVLLLTLCCALGACATPEPTPEGWVEWKGERYALPHVLALQRPVDGELARTDYARVAPDAQSAIWLVMTEHAVPAERAEAETVSRRLLDKAGRGIAVQLGTGGAFLTPIYLYIGSASAPEHWSKTGGAGHVVVTSMEGGRITGRLIKEGKADGIRWNLPFDAPIQQFDAAAMSLWGTPLPAGGGEVGAALARGMAARQQRDLAAILEYGVSDYPDLADASADDQNEMLDQMRDSSMQPSRLLGGLQRGDHAVLIDVTPVSAPVKAPGRIFDDLVCVRSFERKGGTWRQRNRNCHTS